MKKNVKSINGMRLASMSKDWLVRLISLLLAVVLWYFVGGENRIDKNIMVPVEIINLPQNLVISNQYKKEIEVSVSGPRALIADMDKEAIRQVDLSSAVPGTMVMENTNDTISVPRGVTVQRIQPSSIILSLDKLIEKEIPILARTIGRVESGYFLKSKKTNPDVISITGPGTILQGVDKIYTRPVTLTGASRSTQLQTPLELSPQLVDLIGETSVTVELEIHPDAEPVTVDNVPVEATIDGEQVAVTPATVRVVAVIPKKLLAENKDLSSCMRAVARGGKTDRKLRVAIQPQQDQQLSFEVVSVTPEMVTVRDTADGEIQQGSAKVGNSPPLLRRTREKKRGK